MDICQEFKLSERLYYIIGFNYWHNTQVLDLTLWPTMRMSFSVRVTSVILENFNEETSKAESVPDKTVSKNWMVNKENKEYSKQKKEHEQERSKHEQTYLTIQKSRLLRTMEQIPLLINNKKSGNGYNIHGYSKDEKANTYIPIPVHSSRKGHTWTHSNPDDEVIVSTVQTGPTGVTQSRGSDIRILANFRESWLQAPSHRSGILVHRFSSENEAQDEVSQSGN
ncbi:hypothetical protein MG293_020676 [Ovis ammon polii]|uniref:Uncharacterized protein n=1 Tax=Ovis ammon polii TaxID=230172 RepID=A0AAD4TJU1_OVIAM|nr:hypothetical protein MG293_020676 [Ovis ammon polii]